MAETLLLRGVESLERIGDRSARPIFMNNLAPVYRMSGRLDDAVTWARRSVALMRDLEQIEGLDPALDQPRGLGTRAPPSRRGGAGGPRSAGPRPALGVARYPERSAHPASPPLPRSARPDRGNPPRARGATAGRDRGSSARAGRSAPHPGRSGAFGRRPRSGPRLAPGGACGLQDAQRCLPARALPPAAREAVFTGRRGGSRRAAPAASGRHV
ncbi:MAG: hypothetical protein IPK72_23940 [Candidatus Eisenbacteria bacterium]|nr:hypothetical protein [Candidatus Eisenbacteria bacterium]